jgi:hypothetical protein
MKFPKDVMMLIAILIAPTLLGLLINRLVHQRL